MRKRLALLALCALFSACAPLRASIAATRRSARRSRRSSATTSRARSRSTARSSRSGSTGARCGTTSPSSQVHRHQYSAARKLLAHAVAANARDVVALTNYGVMSYHLSDFAEARRTLDEARAAAHAASSTASRRCGRATGKRSSYARATAPLDETAAALSGAHRLGHALRRAAAGRDLMADLRRAPRLAQPSHRAAGDESSTFRARDRGWARCRPRARRRRRCCKRRAGDERGARARRGTR